jgi:hypothetical protein
MQRSHAREMPALFMRLMAITEQAMNHAPKAMRAA